MSAPTHPDREASKSIATRSDVNFARVLGPRLPLFGIPKAPRVHCTATSSHPYKSPPVLCSAAAVSSLAPKGTSHLSARCNSTFAPLSPPTRTASNRPFPPNDDLTTSSPTIPHNAISSIATHPLPSRQPSSVTLVATNFATRPRPLWHPPCVSFINQSIHAGHTRTHI